MAEKIQDKFQRILSQVSNGEKINNRRLARQTKRLLVALEYLRAEMQMNKKGV